MAGVTKVELPVPVIRALDTASCTLDDTRETDSSPDAIPSCTPWIRLLAAVVTGKVLAKATPLCPEAGPEVFLRV